MRLSLTFRASEIEELDFRAMVLESFGASCATACFQLAFTFLFKSSCHPPSRTQQSTALLRCLCTNRVCKGKTPSRIYQGLYGAFPDLTRDLYACIMFLQAFWQGLCNLSGFCNHVCSLTFMYRFPDAGELSGLGWRVSLEHIQPTVSLGFRVTL